MKKIATLTIVFFFSFYNVFAQTEQTKLADMYFDNLSYAKAIQEYKVLVERNPSVYVLQRLGDAYYASLRMKEAAITYAKLLTIYDIKQPEYFFKYSQTLRNLGRIDDANYWMKKYERLKNNSFLAEQNPQQSYSSIQNTVPSRNPLRNNVPVSSPTVYKPVNNISPKKKRNTGKFEYTIENLFHLNTPFSDFGVTEFENTILYSSPRYLNEITTKVDESNRANYLDIYQVDEDDIHTKGRQKRFSKGVNEKFHESSVSFLPDHSKMFFTRNNYNYGSYKVDKKGYINLKIYSAEFINNKWQNIKELPFCSDYYSVGHPTVSKDGKLLYFVSDMPGSLGKTDLYVVKIYPNGRFGKPENLGNTINTRGREMFPHITEDNTLYFSSDGHQGMGNLDVFESKMEYGEFQMPTNLESPINSEADDFAFSFNEQKNRGYLSSNRKGGRGDDDIYLIERVYEEPETCDVMITGTVRNLKFQKYIPYASVTLRDQYNNIIQSINADEYGRYSFELPCDLNYTVTGAKEYYKPETKSFISDTSKVIDLNLDIVDDFEYNHEKEVVIKINDIYFDYDKWNIRPDAARELDHIIAVMKKYPNIIVKSTSHTDARGTYLYNEELSQKRADSSVDYIIYGGISPDRISGKGYGESRLTNKCVDNDWHTNRVYCSEKLHQDNRRTSFVIQNIDEVNVTVAKN